MDPFMLTIEVTGELDRELGEIAEEQMVTKEDIARGIIAVHLAKARETRDNAYVALLGGVLQAAGTTLQTVAKTVAEKRRSEGAMARMVRQEAVKPKGE